MDGMRKRGKGGRREKGTESSFKELMAENFPRLVKEIDIKIQKPKR